MNSRPNKINNKGKRSFVYQSCNDIKCTSEKDNKENIQLKIVNTPIKNKFFDRDLKIVSSIAPIIPKKKKVIIFTENKYDKALQRGKSPFFISDRISFRNEFKTFIFNHEVKQKHLGLCDYYSKNNKKQIKTEKDDENDFSKTPRFHRENKS